MTKIPTLYDKLKPNVKAKLNKSEVKYGSTIRRVIAKLESKYFIGDLTVDELRRVHLFSDTSYVEQSAVSLMWGDEIFDNYEGND